MRRTVQVANQSAGLVLHGGDDSDSSKGKSNNEKQWSVTRKTSDSRSNGNGHSLLLPHAVSTSNSNRKEYTKGLTIKSRLAKRKLRVLVVLILVGIVLAILTLVNNKSDNGKLILSAASKSLSVIEDEIKLLHEEYGHHHAVHPVPEDEFEIDSSGSSTRTTKDGRSILKVSLSDLQDAFHSDEESFRYKPVSRGVSGRPIEETPSLISAKRSHIQCDINVDSLAYWNDNPTDHVSRFHVNGQEDTDVSVSSSKESYISFSPDGGGWNNIRMSMEIIFVIAAATGRTLVLPPKEPLYLLQNDAASRHRGFADFFPLETMAFHSQVKVISFEDFLKLNEPDTNSQFHISDPVLREQVYSTADHCDKRVKSTVSCKVVYEYLKSVGTNANISAVDTCVVFDENYYDTGNNDTVPTEVLEHISLLCGAKRTPFYWTKSFNTENKLIHFRASEKEFRLLSHFYGMVQFTNPLYDNYYKRFVRDYLHYHDEIYCAAGKIVQALQFEAFKASPQYTRDNEGTGGYSAFHVRRGDLQYKKVKIPAIEWYENTKELFYPKEILYIATDEKKKDFFQDLQVHYELRYLDDYWDFAELSTLDPNYMGMIDTIIASRGRVFVGTYFSTFSGYINRLRGYHGIPMNQSYYGYLPHKNHTHTWKIVDDFAYAYEWPDGWVGIDSDAEFSNSRRDVF